MTPPPAPPNRLLLGFVLMLVAFNLRPALSTVGPLLHAIREGTGLSAAGAAVLTTLPVLCLGLACALTVTVIRRIGPDLGVLAGTLVIAAGLALRGFDGLVPLFAGTAVAATGIGLANVLMPALVKRDFPARVGFMTGLYTMMLCLGAAAGAGAAVPIEQAIGHGWAPALAVWALPAALAALAWAPFARKASAGASPAPNITRLLRDPLAWRVTAFMGLQSSLAYVLFGWLPLLLQDRGLSPLDAGLIASLTTLHQAPGALAVATLAARRRDQRGWVVAVLAVTLAAFLALAFGPDAVRLPAAGALGLGIGGCFALGLTLIVLRAADAASAAGLSAMAQGVGYAVACLGPLGFGLAHEATGGWGLSAALFAAITVCAGLAGLGAGRDRQVGA
ncbi:MFS transporter [Methylobacterium trifolii]|uniref:Transporter YycB n=1 Tax=Methylobacterium trifolii TaxID=1003092 RepID=A0ABQ4U5J9_9HYPH|nr:MFS transporter [Methylobacterium trifolii]GJE61085.1 putative transporter YycB [Methylobacterium trifolii]